MVDELIEESITVPTGEAEVTIEILTSPGVRIWRFVPPPEE